MRTALISSLLVLTLFGGSAVSAQTYTYGSGACVNLTSDLSIGSRGTQVSQLQSFLVAQNYPGGGSWMVTGYFGQATAAAVRIFQQQHGLPQTGIVEGNTRAAINIASCGYLAAPISNVYPYDYSYNYGYNNTNPFSYSYNYTNPYQNQYQNPYQYPQYPYTYQYGAVALTSMSQNTGIPGNSITLYGTGFDPVGNTVHFGTQVLSGIPSSNNTSLTFTVPSYYTYAANQEVQIYVTNSHGTSNKLSFTLYPGGYGYQYGYQYGYPYGQYQGSCNSYPYSYTTGCGCQYGGLGCPVGTPQILYLQPQTGAVGTTVTVYGSGFTTTNNSVHFGNGIIANLNSPDGRSVAFTVPSTLTGFGSQPVIVGTYNVSVTNGNGANSNSMPFSVTSTGPQVAPSIHSLTGPTALAIGEIGTWTVKVTNPSGGYLTVSVDWGDTGVYGYAANAPQAVYAQGESTLTFTHIYYTGGTYSPRFTVSNAQGQQNSTSASVTVSGTTPTNPVTLSHLSPSSGTVGTQIVLTGSGFSSYGNVVHFGVGGSMNVPSYNGTTIYFTVPSYVSPCDVIQTFAPCTQYVQPVTPGSYPVYVTNANGTSGTLHFQVY